MSETSEMTGNPERKEKTPPESKEGAPQPQDKVQPPAKGEKTTPEQRTPRLRVTLEQQPVPDKLQDKYVQAVAAWGILVGGIALAIGLMTRMAGLLIILIELGAIYTVTWDRGSLSLGGFGPVGFEYNVVIIVACLTLLLLGGGEFALDRYLFRRKPTAKA